MEKHVSEDRVRLIDRDRYVAIQEIPLTQAEIDGTTDDDNSAMVEYHAAKHEARAKQLRDSLTGLR